MKQYIMLQQLILSAAHFYSDCHGADYESVTLNGGWTPTHYSTPTTDRFERGITLLSTILLSHDTVTVCHKLTTTLYTLGK